jgi:hypothetical protein
VLADLFRDQAIDADAAEELSLANELVALFKSAFGARKNSKRWSRAAVFLIIRILSEAPAFFVRGAPCVAMQAPTVLLKTKVLTRS